jgi:hypothetical protein
VSVVARERVVHSPDMPALDTDYLVVGAGAAGLAFTDALIAAGDADVVIVDRRDTPGGHWNDAYSFVRLHQPSAMYGVNSRPLGQDRIDTTGSNAGLYERATGPEIVEYFRRVLDDTLLASGRVRFLAMCDYLGEESGEHHVRSRLTGEVTTLRVRRRLVDARYYEASIPSTHTPSFEVDDDVRFIPVNDLVDVGDAPSGFTLIGSGKTAMDACAWLLEHGVDPDAIRWIRPRDAWLLNRSYIQPLDLVSWLIEGIALSFEAAAAASDPEDLFARLEGAGQLARLDPAITPSMYRCATSSEAEIATLRRVTNVVRRGHVRRITTAAVAMSEGELSSDARQVYVDCSAGGLRLTPPRPVFEPGRVTIQPLRTCQPTFSAALTGFVEAARDTDEERNALVRAYPYPNVPADWISMTVMSQGAERRWSREQDVAAWLEAARLNGARGAVHHLDEPRMQAALTSLGENAVAGMTRLRSFLPATS